MGNTCMSDMSTDETRNENISEHNSSDISASTSKGNNIGVSMKDKQSSNSDIENYDDITEKKNTTKRSISHIIIRWFTTLSGLFVLLLVITLGGAILFRSIEEENDDILLEKLESGRRIVEETIMNYSTIFLIHKNVTSKDQSNLNELYEDIVEQIKDYVATRDSIRKWTYVNSVFFCITTYTTIGYGYMAPSTILGRLLLMPYAVLGIIVTITFFSKLGKALDKYLKYYFYDTNIGKLAKYTGLPDVYIGFIHLLFCLVTCMCVNAIIFMVIEEMTFLDALYFVFVTATTIGYGDIAPRETAAFIFVSLLIFIMLSAYSTFFAYAQEIFLSKIKQLSDHIQDSPCKDKLYTQ